MYESSDDPSKQYHTVSLLRHDENRSYYVDGDPNECEVRTDHSRMASFWSWVDDAKYIGRRTIRHFEASLAPAPTRPPPHPTPPLAGCLAVDRVGRNADAVCGAGRPQRPL